MKNKNYFLKALLLPDFQTLRKINGKTSLHHLNICFMCLRLRCKKIFSQSTNQLRYAKRLVQLLKLHLHKSWLMQKQSAATVYTRHGSL